MITITGEIHSSKNSRRIFRSAGRVIVSKSAASKADESSFAWQLIAQRDEWFFMTDGCAYPLRVVFQFRRKTRGRFDYINISQGILDAMTAAGYIPDDNADYVIPVFLPYAVDKNNPGCDITIERDSG